MADEFTRYEVDPGGKFRYAVSKALEEVDDLRPAFLTITESWFKSNKAIFALKGPGKYADLKQGYKKQKQSAVGFVYPILRRSGFLEKSITQPGDPDSIVRMGKASLELGSAVPYGPFLQYGTKKMPARPFILVGAEQVAPDAINKRRELWIETIQNWVAQVVEKRLAG